MPDYQDRMKDYVPVNERIAAFIEANPEGCLQSEIVELTDTRVTVKAYAYRSPDDQRPGTGHSSLNIPGSTPYTKGSEIENAETSAWGRAIAALGFEVKRGIASTEEIRNKASGQGTEGRYQRSGVGGHRPPPDPATDKRAVLAQLAAERDLGLDAIEQYATLVGIEQGTRATDEQMDALIAAVSGHGSDAELVIPQVAAEPEVAPDPPSPPKPATDEYKALEPHQKAEARAYWAETVTA